VSEAFHRQGLGREMVEPAEATAQAIAISIIKVYPLQEPVGFRKSLGYTPDESVSRVLKKELH
jgi:hypothetical protein